MSDNSDKPEVERPRFEPEILPPLGKEREAQYREEIRIFRLGPFATMAVGFGVLALGVLMLFLFAGALLIALPVVALMALGSILAFKFRNRFRR